MNIQPSVILWTILCFLLMAVILDRLLFRPVLNLLDERKKQLAEARQRKAEYEKRIEERNRQREELQLEQARKKSACVQAAVEKIQNEEKTLLKDAQRECLVRIDVYREQREKELEEILSAVSPKMEQAAELFVQRIVSGPDQRVI